MIDATNIKMATTSAHAQTLKEKLKRDLKENPIDSRITLYYSYSEPHL